MAKDWIQIDTIYNEIPPKTKAELAKASKNYKKLMAKTKTLSVIDMKKKSVELYNEQKEKENSLIQAFDDKKLKSDKAIKQAIRIKKERAKRKNSAKQDTEKVSNEQNETTESSV